jgi:hypothetical protein
VVCSALLRSLDSPEPLLDAERTEEALIGGEEPTGSSTNEVSSLHVPVSEEQSDPVGQEPSETRQEENEEVSVIPKPSASADVGPPVDSLVQPAEPVRHPSGDQSAQFSCSVCSLKFKKERDMQKHDCFLLASDSKPKGRKRKLGSRTSSKKRSKKKKDKMFFQCPFQDCNELEVGYTYS